MKYQMAIHTCEAALLAGLFAGCADRTNFNATHSATDLFHQIYNNQQLDFLWVVDNSASMQDKRNYLRNNLQTFLTTLNTRKAIDYQMAVTTTDMFSFAGSLVSSPTGLQVVRSNSADPGADFASIINNVQDTNTSFWEQGLESAYQAVSHYHAIFSRVGVPLVLVFVSDEEDYSCQDHCFGVEPEHNPDWIPFNVSRYTQFFGAFKTAENATVTAFSIVGVGVQSCQVASIGQRYLTVSQQLGGSGGSICNVEIPSSFQNIAHTISDRGIVFTLSQRASGVGISVYVNGLAISNSMSNGFTFDASLNAIVFSGSAIPANGSRIEVNYVLAN